MRIRENLFCYGHFVVNVTQLECYVKKSYKVT